MNLGPRLTQKGRKSLLSSYVLSWLRTEIQMVGSQTVARRVGVRRIDYELTELMGHHDGKKDAGNQNVGTRMKPFSEWAGGVHEGAYLSLLAEQVEAEVEIDPLKPGLRGVVTKCGRRQCPASSATDCEEGLEQLNCTDFGHLAV